MIKMTELFNQGEIDELERWLREEGHLRDLEDDEYQSLDDVIAKKHEWEYPEWEDYEDENSWKETKK